MAASFLIMGHYQKQNEALADLSATSVVPRCSFFFLSIVTMVGERAGMSEIGSGRRGRREWRNNFLCAI